MKIHRTAKKGANEAKKRELNKVEKYEFIKINVSFIINYKATDCASFSPYSALQNILTDDSFCGGKVATTLM